MTSRKSTVASLPSALIYRMSTVLMRHGLDISSACSARNLDLFSCTEKQTQIPRALFEQFERCIADLCLGRPALWGELGMSLRLPAYGVLGLSCLCAPSMSHVNAMLAEDFRGLPFSLARLDPCATEHDAGLRWDLTEVPVELRDYTLVRDMAASLTAANDMWGGDCPSTRFTLAPAYRHLLPIVEAFGKPVEIRNDGCCIYWSADIAERTLPLSDKELHFFYARQCRALLSRGLFDDAYPNRVASILEGVLLIAPQEVSIERIAGQLGTSVRTLQRKLIDHGLSFRELHDRVRKELAAALLVDQALTHSDIAFRLGYQEVSSFYHAFKRWFGTNPGNYRESLNRSR